MTRKMNVVMTGINAAVLMGIFLFLGKAWAVEVKPLAHPAFQQLPSQTLFQENGGRNVETSRGKETAMARMNHIEFQKTIQNLTAPNAFRAERPIVESENPNRKTNFTHGGVQ